MNSLPIELVSKQVPKSLLALACMIVFWICYSGASEIIKLNVMLTLN